MACRDGQHHTISISCRRLCRPAGRPLVVAADRTPVVAVAVVGTADRLELAAAGHTVLASQSLRHTTATSIDNYQSTSFRRAINKFTCCGTICCCP